MKHVFRQHYHPPVPLLPLWLQRLWAWF